MTLARCVALTAVVLCRPTAAAAHGFAGDGGPAAGALHPLSGIDHLLAMVTVGVLSAQMGGWAIWAVPAAFLAAVLTGGITAMAGVTLPGVEPGVAASVLALGVAVAAGGRLPLGAAVALAAAFGLFHGFAHGLEMPRSASPPLYALGFSVTTAGLHVMGALAGLIVLCHTEGRRRLRYVGTAVGLAGGVLLLR